jgi:hypothetical protein
VIEVWAPRKLKEAKLRELEAEFGANPASMDIQFERACLLDETGRTAEARDAYVDMLARDSSHRGALNNLGTLLNRTGYRTAARTAFSQAVAHHPADPMSRVNLANSLCDKGDLAGAREHFEAVLHVESDNPEAHQGLSRVLTELGDRAGAARHRKPGYGGRPVMLLPYRGESAPLSVLVLAGTAGGSVPVRNFLDDRVFQTAIIFPEFFDPATPLPPHQVVFNAIGDPDSEAPALLAAERVLAMTTAPVINAPARVAATGRGDNAQRLAEIPGVITSSAVTMPRAVLAGPDAAAALRGYGFNFPLLMRTPGYHTGRHFERLETAEDLPGTLAALPGEELTVLRYLDARGPDGKVRKYRVMMIDGALYPLHAAISGHWKVHYFTADMANDAGHRAEDAAFLDDMPGVLGPRPMAALAEIQSRLGLDYAGIDFGLSAGGDLLLFEANATMVVNPVINSSEPEEKWAYRRGAVERIYAAVHNMLFKRSVPARRD